MNIHAYGGARCLVSRAHLAAEIRRAYAATGFGVSSLRLSDKANKTRSSGASRISIQEYSGCWGTLKENARRQAPPCRFNLVFWSSPASRRRDGDGGGHESFFFKRRITRDIKRRARARNSARGKPRVLIHRRTGREAGKRPREERGKLTKSRSRAIFFLDRRDSCNFSLPRFLFSLFSLFFLLRFAVDSYAARGNK